MTELDPDMRVDKMTYVISMDEFLSTQEVPVETVGLVERFTPTIMGNILSDYFSLQQGSPTLKVKTIYCGTRNHRYFWVQK